MSKAYIQRLFEYTIADVDHLLGVAEGRARFCRPAGPIFMVMMNGISAMSGVMYGFDVDEGERFIKFLVDYMDISESIAVFFYHGCRVPLSQSGMPVIGIFYSHADFDTILEFKGRPGDGYRKIHSDWDELFSNDSFLAILDKGIAIHVGNLARVYLKAFRKLQTDFEDNPDNWSDNDLSYLDEEGLKYFDAAYAEIENQKKDE